jgi:hypothetical protein
MYMTTVRSLILMIPIMMVAFVPFLARSSSIEPAAIIEKISASGSTLQAMDFVFTGDTIELGNAGVLRLSYLLSCIVEEFVGATVIVGETKSAHLGGKLSDQLKVDCDGGGIAPTSGQSEDAAAVVFRVPVIKGKKQPVMVYSTEPVFVLQDPTEELVVTRQDAGSNEEYRFPINVRYLDLAEHNVHLAAGGNYLVRSKSGANATFSISSNAISSNNSLISRLVRY